MGTDLLWIQWVVNIPIKVMWMTSNFVSSFMLYTIVKLQSGFSKTLFFQFRITHPSICVLVTLNVWFIFNKLFKLIDIYQTVILLKSAKKLNNELSLMVSKTIVHFSLLLFNNWRLWKLLSREMFSCIKYPKLRFNVRLSRLSVPRDGSKLSKSKYCYHCNETLFIAL